ncbi:MAG: hypothetical protein J1E16_10980 [Muribaculaceae bacterium]|nr:hypothetical protein [Muribaculaceae bacterium]
MKKLLSLILLITTINAVVADDSNWKFHPIFDEEVSHVIDTPDLVYFTSQTLIKTNNTESFFSLFRYDKKGEELMTLSSSNILNDNSIRDVIYNPKKGYLAILYKNYNIDLLYNDGKVVNIPYYKQSSLSSAKDVNSISIDPEKDRLYLATDFGYVAINDKKGEVAESRIYNTSLNSFCRLGDTYLVAIGNNILTANTDSPRLSIDQYEHVAELENQVKIYPLSDTLAIVLVGDTKNYKVKKLTLNDSGVELEDVISAYVYNVEYNSSGLLLGLGDSLYLFKTDGSTQKLSRHDEFRNSAVGSENMTEIWNGLKRKGLSSLKNNGQQWSLTRDWMLPNAPAAFASTSFVNHPDKGLLVLDYGYTTVTQNLPTNSPFQLSAYKQGRWTNLAPAYTNPDRTNLMTATNGMAVDPDNSKYVYISSYHNGFARINLNDPNDIIHFARKEDADAKNDGFVELIPTPAKYPGFANISAPYFDKQGNLWMNYADWDDEADPNPHFYCWLAADRKATTNAANALLPKLVEFDANFPIRNLSLSLPLLKTGNGLIVHAGSLYDEKLAILDYSGTPTDMSDDKVYMFPDFTDSDGNPVEVRNINCIWEDPSTGYVWVGHLYGVFYFVPSQILQGNYQIYRVKVPRNDGTNLADYLLEGVRVNNITSDGEGRKWFSTGGGGIICTSSDGREIIEEFNISNSPLPDDVVYSIGYNSGTNSLMISTAQGFAEYNLPVSQSSSTKEDIKAYPNPVRPDYSGYVTITDIPTGSFVKIVDSAGNLVKELGIVSGFSILWDISDSNFNRVRSGVYHIMVSPSDETSSYSTVGKILVMS